MTRANSDADFPCVCGVIERATDEPDIPIIFDKMTNEFQLKCGPENRRRSITLYYCYFCGGRMPESRRDQLFARVTVSEEHRLRELAKEIKTIDDAIRILGKPDADRADGLRTHMADSDTEPTEINSYRTITYLGLSKTADVTFIDHREHGVAIQFTGKYLEGDT
jgi:hypothetical protein